MPSQLHALKSELARVGLSRHSQPATGKRKRSQSRGPQDQDRDKRAAQLERIHDKFNQFDTKVTKLKHEVAGRKLKGVTGRPTTSKQAAIDLRKNTILVEYAQKNHAGGILDRRFGENNPTMTPEERMQERFTRERQRAAKLNAFSLDDDTELTHYGQSLSNMDDFDTTGLALDDEDDAMDLDRDTVARAHFGGFDEDGGKDDDLDSNGEPRKKSKAEVMAEVMAKSKEHKYLRQQNQERQEAQRQQLDDEYAAVRALLAGAQPDKVAPPASSTHTDKDYDTLVRELVFDHRSKPSDRTKTEDELAEEEKTKLEKLERARLRRMRGEPDEGDDEELKRYAKRRKQQRGGDDLEDDFAHEDDGIGLGAGLGEDLSDIEDGILLSEDEKDEPDSEEDTSGEDSGSKEGESEGENDDDNDVNQNGDTTVGNSATSSKSARKPAQKELPYTFPCPSTHAELLRILEDVEDSDVPTVIKRIRTLYHPSLANDNKSKIETLCGVVLDHLAHISAPPTPNFALVTALLPQFTQLCQTCPIPAAEAFVAKLKLMHKNFGRGLAHGPTLNDSKTWPGSAELVLLRLIGTIWPTSDKAHVVIGPARLLVASFLGLSRVRSLEDIASGLYLSTLVLQFERLSQRLVPEAVNFLFNAVVHLAPHSINNPNTLPGTFPTPDFGETHCPSLKLSKKAKSLSPRKANLAALLSSDSENGEQVKVDLLACTLDVLGRLADLYKGLDGFIELFTPLQPLLNAVNVQQYPPELKRAHDALVDRLTRLLKFSLQARRPLRLQAHKAIAIASYIPKFNTNGGSNSTFLRTQDPDRERAEAAKLRREYREERKGAIKELRKDAKFMAEVVHKQQTEKDRSYNDRMKRVHGSIEGERAEEKAMEREKSKIKKRAGKR